MSKKVKQWLVLGCHTQDNKRRLLKSAPKRFAIHFASPAVELLLEPFNFRPAVQDFHFFFAGYEAMTSSVSVHFPSRCTPRSVFGFCSRLQACSNLDRVIINFQSMRRIEPFAMVYSAKQVREFSKKNRSTEVRHIEFQNKSYASNMGFFRALDLEQGREPGYANSDDQFIPYTIRSIQSLTSKINDADEKLRVPQAIIEREAEHLARILSQQKHGNLVDALAYAIREMIRNVYEHSESESIEYCAQYWPTYNQVEIVIADAGVGLRRSLALNPRIRTDSDSDAIQQALMPAISGKRHDRVRGDVHDPWRNAGFGLYMISRICRLGGDFLICSGDHAIRLNEDGKEHIDLGHQCEGTVVRMVLNTHRLRALSEILKQFRDEGHETAKHIKGVGVYSAAMASQMLSRDFAKD